MKTIHALKALVLVFATSAIISCGSQYKGSAADRTGTNGATNGTGKAPSGTAHNFRY
ncbi:hypothetical protein [Flavobacterium sp.]|uniref:hypothetical protein n=1 Tax=Flavobacterium sp. TaxID=239 RepID=UPI0025C35F76|nr:hypothetical protein [Flavobacterium sp.]